ncbi:TPA: MFS transporter [Escherichia coli]|uniref:MFS transporter n=1 Tax=Pseudomonadota TaxID=1224 RepID=UPI00287E0218|nr:MFS transporter [Escherichia coli]HEA1241054.1 MFS transporter [Escherichia coli]HEA1933017.1 MFS transporter [Escherichia coli]HEA2340438.1 MFS transporter [Escherichia coli]
MTASPAVARPALSRGHYTLVLLALALGFFAIGTSEFAPIGLLPSLTAGLAISEQQVGHIISAYALGVVVGAPLLAITCARLRRKPMLLALLALYVAGSVATALAPGYYSMVVARFVVGLPHGAFFGVAALAAAAITPTQNRGKVVGQVFSGLTVALLLGNPLATWLGQALSWRLAFWFVALVLVLTMALIAWLLPDDRSEHPARPLAELKAFNRAPVWLALAIGAIGFAGMFCVFSYLAPAMTEVAGLSKRWIPFGMVAFGVGAFIGAQAGGWLFDKFGLRAIAIILGWSLLVLLAFGWAAHSPWLVLPAAALVGTMMAMSPALQLHLMDVAGKAQTLAAACNHSAFNFANALGPWLGGMAVAAGASWSVIGPVGAATALAGLGIWWLAERVQARHSPKGR